MTNSINVLDEALKFANRKARWAFVFFTAVVFLLGTAVFSFAQDERMIGGGVGITVFVDRDFRGTTRTFTNDVPDLRAFGFDNRISSFRVAANEFWQVCDGPNFTGRCITVSREESDLRRNNWDNSIRSMRRISGGGGGGGQTSTPPSWAQGTFTSIDSRDNITLTIAPNGAVTAVNNGQTFSGSFFRDTITLNNHTSDVTRTANGIRTFNRDTRQTINYVRAGGGGTFPPGPGNDFIVLFNNANFSGSSTRVDRANANLNRLARSVTLSGRPWQLCNGRNFSGRCITVSTSVNDLGRFSMSRQVSSARPTGWTGPGGPCAS